MCTSASLASTAAASSLKDLMREASSLAFSATVLRISDALASASLPSATILTASSAPLLLSASQALLRSVAKREQYATIPLELKG
ncbi:MAG: hypothetical protein QW680_11820 [Pyrobaculum sp.]